MDRPAVSQEIRFERHTVLLADEQAARMALGDR
jgi:hypothetical protein